jgi:hypothetical protein
VLKRPIQVVEKARQLDGSVDPAANDLGADATFANQQALTDQFGDRPSGGRSGHPALVGEGDLIAQVTSRRQLPGGDRAL